MAEENFLGSLALVGASKKTAIEALHWVAELDYGADFFAKNIAGLRSEMGLLYSFPDHRQRVLDFLEGALEHAGELTHALKKLQEIVHNG